MTIVNAQADVTTALRNWYFLVHPSAGAGWVIEYLVYLSSGSKDKGHVSRKVLEPGSDLSLQFLRDVARNYGMRIDFRSNIVNI